MALLKSVFPIRRRKSVSERLVCQGCGISLTPSNQSHDANFCKACLRRLEGAFGKREVSFQVVEKPVTIIKTVVQKDQGLTESLVLATERINGLALQLRSLRYENRHLKKKYERLKRFGPQ